jgi:hypothetical protein
MLGLRCEELKGPANGEIFQEVHVEDIARVWTREPILDNDRA